MGLLIDHDGGDGEIHTFRFGTLSSIVWYHVGGGDDRMGELYLDLPEWAEVNSPSSLRDIPEKDMEQRGVIKSGKGLKTR